MNFEAIMDDFRKGMEQLCRYLNLPVRSGPDVLPAADEAAAGIRAAIESASSMARVREAHVVGVIDEASLRMRSGRPEPGLAGNGAMPGDSGGMLVAGIALRARNDGAMRPTRHELAQFARSAHRQYPDRCMALAIAYGQWLTIAVVNAAYPSKVTLLRDFDLLTPQAGPIRLLGNLRDRLKDGSKCKRFADFMRIWESVFDVSGMSRQAVKELLEWHERQRRDRTGGADSDAERSIRMLIERVYDRFLTELREPGAVGVPTQPDSLASVLDRYPFTTEENTPTEEDAALDPALLGELYENLLARERSGHAARSVRVRTGTFYTSGEVVHYMAGRSLAIYLRERLIPVFGEVPGLDEDLHRLLASEDEQPIRQERVRAEIVALLGASAVFDPACGSGAFPLGILHVMARTLRKLDPEMTMWKQAQLRKAERIADNEERRAAIEEIDRVVSDKPPDFARKLFLIRECVYGADIQPTAVRICRMRMLLSLLSDDDRRGDAGAVAAHCRTLDLPSRLIAADLLIPPDKPEQVAVSGDPALRALRDTLMRTRRRLSAAAAELAADSEQLQQLREAEQALSARVRESLVERGCSDAAAKQLADWNPYAADGAASFFDKEWMLGRPDGFDIVIGNPPYLGERKNKAAFRAVQQSRTGKYYLGRMDYFYFFFHVGIDILKEAGVGAYITTNYYLTALGARKLRQDLRDRTTLLEMVNFNEARIFAGAAGQHNLITLFRKGRQETAVRVKEIEARGILSGRELAQRLQPGPSDLRIAQSELWDGEESYLRLGGMVGSGDGNGIDIGSSRGRGGLEGYSGGSPINPALDRLKQAATDVLGNVCRPLIGLESSLDEIYVGSRTLFDGIVKDPAEWACIKPFFKNSDIGKYRVADRTNRYLLYLHEQSPDIRALPGIYRYLLAHEARIKARKGANLRGAYRRGNWWVLNTPRLDMDFEDEKIVTPYRSRTTRFALTSAPWYASRDVYYIVRRKPDISLHYILALLNSSLYFQWLYHRGKRKGGMLELYAKPLKEIPIREIDAAGQRPFAQLAKLAIYAAANAPHRLGAVERAIDALVFDLIFGDEMIAQRIDTSVRIEADLREVLGERDWESVAAGVRAERLDELVRRWTDPAGEVRSRMDRYAERSPDLLKPILEQQREGRNGG